ncbi:hypothetical protein DEU56DRAFT_904014 [Suillus clintonianus]|uniref:uncharacterized protein n=1 Tax=Suillus clintonianus TaxID=1904413 RepID=UPI001B85DC04|nr:uncharacterized protein DEU56DRAFT_904014 [Suillus clintonianus]KAG2124223.1 hypothetical protein DEU56DRAFT_904014 [Suillus clintonianus]
MYTLQKLVGSLQLRLAYLLPKCRLLLFTAVHASPSFCDTAARIDLQIMLGHVPFLESQIRISHLIQALTHLLGPGNGFAVTAQPYTAIAYRTPFPTNGFSKIFLEQDRITLTWVRDFDTVDIQVVSPGHGVNNSRSSRSKDQLANRISNPSMGRDLNHSYNPRRSPRVSSSTLQSTINSQTRTLHLGRFPMWWMSADDSLFIRDCNTNTNPSRAWLKHTSLPHWLMRHITIDPLQDLMVTVASIGTVIEENHHTPGVVSQS